MRDYLSHSEELFVISGFDQAVCGAKAAPTPPDVGDEYSTYRRTLGPILAPMKVYRLIISILVLLAIFSFKKSQYFGDIYITAGDWNGLISVGHILDFSEKPFKSYSTSRLHDKHIVEVIEDSIFIESEFFGTVSWMNNQLMIVSEDHKNSVWFHKLNKTEKSISLDDVKDFLNSNSIIFEERDRILKMQYNLDTIMYGKYQLFAIDSLRNSLVYSEIPWEGILYYDLKARWQFAKIKNSIIIYQSPFDPADGIIEDVFLVSNIIEDTLYAKKIQVPFYSRQDLESAMKEGSDFQFKYEDAKFYINNSINNKKVDHIHNLLVSKSWESDVPEHSTIIGRVHIIKGIEYRIHPKKIRNIKYTFDNSGKYTFHISDSIYTGKYEFSKDPNYLILDKYEDYMSCVEIRNISKDKLELQQHHFVPIGPEDANIQTSILVLK